MNIRFTKTVGSGNDFIIIDNRDGKLSEELPDFAEKLCQRKLSIGADGLLVLEDSKKADFKMRIFNPDGSEAAMCGNGSRCSALYAYKNNWCGKSLKMETGAGIIEAEVENDNVKIKMTEPTHIELNKDLGLGKTFFKAHFINTGVPHVVHFLDERDLKDYPVNELGSKIRYHKVFEPQGTNANFVKVISGNRIEIRTYERGVEDETLACGTGAVASSIISNLVNGTKEPVEVLTQSGEILKVHFKSNKNKISNVYLEGPANIVYIGEIEL